MEEGQEIQGKVLQVKEPMPTFKERVVSLLSRKFVLCVIGILVIGILAWVSIIEGGAAAAGVSTIIASFCGTNVLGDFAHRRYPQPRREPYRGTPMPHHVQRTHLPRRPVALIDPDDDFDGDGWDDDDDEDIEDDGVRP